ncbi:MAG: glycosyltransferase family 39 protein [Candidatus Aenigmarchaeota archaeon]|nr:glycosyltransferase family 39 protein [Candidatus Aenigmarchaeota archaeon]
MKKKINSMKEWFFRILPLILIANFFFIIIYYSITYPAQKTLEEMLITIEPIFLTVNFALIIISLSLSLKDIKKVLKTVKKSTWIILFLILLMGFILRMYFTPHTHRVYFDEDIYLDIGKEILTERKACLCNYGDHKGCYECILMKWPNGHPFTFAIAFLFFGISEVVAHNLSVLLGTLSILLLFLVGYLISKKVEIGLYSALLFAFVPMIVVWSGTVAAEPFFIFYTLLAVFSFLLMIETDKWNTNLLAASSVAFASQFKAESGAVIALIALIMFLFDEKFKMRTKSTRFLISYLILFVLITPYVIHVYHSSKTDPWGSSGKKFGFDYVIKNAAENALFWIKGYDTIEHPFVFTVFAIIGLIYVAIKERKISIFLGLWFLIFFTIYAFFYAGSVRYGTDVRYSLSGYPPFVLLGGFGLYFIHKLLMKKIRKEMLIFALLIFVVMLTFYFYLPSVSTPAEKIVEANQARIYHDRFVEYASKLDKNCYIMSHVPSMYLILDIGSLQTWNGQNENIMKELFEKTDCVIFDDGFWCNIEPYKSSVCKYMFDKYNMTELTSVAVDEGRHSYTLYKVSNPY